MLCKKMLRFYWNTRYWGLEHNGQPEVCPKIRGSKNVFTCHIKGNCWIVVIYVLDCCYLCIGEAEVSDLLEKNIFYRLEKPRCQNLRLCIPFPKLKVLCN